MPVNGDEISSMKNQCFEHLWRINGQIFTNDIYSIRDSDELRIQRTLLRDGLSREQIQTVISKQLSQSEIEKRCDYVIYNDGTHSLISQVLKVHQLLMIKLVKIWQRLTKIFQNNYLIK
jgi:dephospho-CoA kinase